MLVGTKEDKHHQREVPTDIAQQFADYHNLLFLETSSKTGQNVEKTFSDLALKIYDKLEEGKFRIEEGWDGIKSGYMMKSGGMVKSRNSPAINLVEASTNESNSSNDSKSQKKSCC